MSNTNRKRCGCVRDGLLNDTFLEILVDRNGDSRDVVGETRARGSASGRAEREGCHGLCTTTEKYSSSSYIAMHDGEILYSSHHTVVVAVQVHTYDNLIPSRTLPRHHDESGGHVPIRYSQASSGRKIRENSRDALITHNTHTTHTRCEESEHICMYQVHM